MANVELDSADFKSFKAICDGLPGVGPRKTLWRLRELYDLGQDTMIGSIKVTIEELGELFVPAVRGFYASERVSPAGARLLVRLYEAGELETEPSAVSEEVRRYCNSEPELREKVRARERAKAEYEERLNQPERIKEEDFDYGLLNDLFWHHGLQGNSRMIVGGIEVQKTVTRYMSNSGKSRDFAVTFNWVGSDGKRRHATKPSMYENNRRNDPERNWGLPE